MVHRHGGLRLADRLAEGGGEIQRATGLEAQRDLVVDRAGDPLLLGDPGDEGEPQASGLGDHPQDRGDSGEPRDGLDVFQELGARDGGSGSFSHGRVSANESWGPGLASLKAIR